jgi:glycosyltransferase involved in cell wall biosynthesis
VKTKVVRTSTVAMSLNYLLKGQLEFLNKEFEVIAVSGHDENLKEVALREKVQVYPIEIQRKISPIKDLISLVKLYFYFKKEKPQIVHSITPKAGLLSMVAAKYAGVPIRLHTFTGLIFPTKEGFIKYLLIFMDKLLCKYATHIYPEGNGVKNDLINYKITNKPLKIIANGNVNGIDLDCFSIHQVLTEQQNQLKNELDILPEDFVFIFVGRLVGDKGINELIAAFRQLSSGTTKVKLLLVGSFETELDPLEQETIEEINGNENIISVGFQNDVRPYFSISDSLTFPSYREGFPNVVMQAGAMGLPSIVTNINGCNEIIIEGQNGTIIPVKDSDTLYKEMRKMIDDTDFRTRLQQNARAMIVSRYEQQLVWDAVLAEYKRLEKNV